MTVSSTPLYFGQLVLSPLHVQITLANTGMLLPRTASALMDDLEVVWQRFDGGFFLSYTIIHVTARCIIFIYSTSSQSLNAAAIVSDLVRKSISTSAATAIDLNWSRVPVRVNALLMSNTGFLRTMDFIRFVAQYYADRSLAMLVLSGYITGSSPMVSPESLLIHPSSHSSHSDSSSTKPHVKDAYFAPARGVVEDPRKIPFTRYSTVQLIEITALVAVQQAAIHYSIP